MASPEVRTPTNGSLSRLPESAGRSVRASSMPSLIAWLSVCVLSAGFGRLLPDTLAAAWTYVGLFGLAAAVGLGIERRSRAQRQKLESERAMYERLEKTLRRPG